MDGRAGGGSDRSLESAVHQIVAGYVAGTRFGIRMDTDGLLAAGIPGAQLTWMDARVGDQIGASSPRFIRSSLGTWQVPDSVSAWTLTDCWRRAFPARN